MTENHDYNRPDKGTTDWDVPLNDNFEQLDSDVEIRDLDENRADYAPKAGAKYLATDTKRVYLGDGSSWNYFTSLGGLPGQVYVGDTEPTDATEGDVWLDTSDS